MKSSTPQIGKFQQLREDSNEVAVRSYAENDPDTDLRENQRHGTFGEIYSLKTIDVERQECTMTVAEDGDHFRSL